MFDNIGTKLKGLAKIMCWFGIIATVIYGVLVWVIGGSGAFLKNLHPLLDR